MNQIVEQEADLLEQVKNGSKEAFSKVYEQFSGRVYAYGIRITGNHEAATELVQETFIRLWEKRSLYKSGLTSPEYYLFTIARNIYFNKIRNKKHLNSLPAKILSPHDLYAHTERQDMLNKALLQLNPDIRETFTLICIEGFKYREAAEMLQVSQKTIEWRMKKAFQTLRELLKDYFQGEIQ